MRKPELSCYIVRVDYPSINESRYLSEGGQLWTDRNYAGWKTHREALEAASTLGPNAFVEPAIKV